MSWVTYNSPLYGKDTLNPVSSTSRSPRRDTRKLEKSFVLDAVGFTKYKMARRQPIIPPYDAVKDKYASAYFQSPNVKAIMERNALLKDLYRKRSINKLSTRQRCKVTPTPDDLRLRQKNFVNDAIRTECKRNKYHDIIPPYRADEDDHCRKYFQRKDVQRLLSITFSSRK